MSYPTQAQIRRAVKAAELAGICVAGVRVEPDGAIVIFDKSAQPTDEFEQWLEGRKQR